MASDAADELPPSRPARFGPFHRLKSPTQTIEDALEQRRSGELWGLTPRHGLWARVEADDGPLPDGWDGIEFYSELAPDPTSHRHHRSWSGHPKRDDVRNAGEFAIIKCEIVRIVERGIAI